MKIGIKIYRPERDYLNRILKHVDFIEVMAVEGESYRLLEGIDIPFVIHMEHYNFGVNPANPSLEKRNRKALDFALSLADRLNSETVIMHPGFLENKNCSESHSLDFIRNILDSRIIVENMPCRSLGIGLRILASTPEDMKRMMKETGKGFCFDFGHAGAAACFLKKDHVKFAGEFMKLKPRHFHVSDGKTNIPKDMHLHLGDGNLNLAAFRRMLPKNAWVTVETGKESIEKQIRDIEFMRG